jgi:hypothetical protein
MKRIALLAALAVGACTSTGQNAVSTYAGFGEVFRAEGTDWRVTDRADLGSLVVSPSYADSIASLLPINIDLATGQRVAAAFIAPRGCTVTGAQSIIGSVEVTYAC